MTPKRARALVGHTPGPVAWEIFVAGCGSINSETMVARFETTAKQWADKGAVVTPLFKLESPELLAGYLAATDENERLRELLNQWISVHANCEIVDHVCCCGDMMDDHAEPIICGHVATDHGAYVASNLERETRAALKEPKP